MRARFINMPSGPVRVLHEGEGPPIVMVHGLGTSAERWSRNIDSLAEFSAVYAPDLYNSGFSGNTTFAGAAPQRVHCEQLRALCGALNITKASFVGSSYGGLIVALLAIEFPELVQKLVIVGSGSAFHPPAEQEQSIRAARDNAMRAFNEGGLAALRQRFVNIAFEPAAVAEESLLVQLTANALPGRAEALVSLYDGILGSIADQNTQAFQRLSQIKAPTLIVTGREDPRAKWVRAEEASRRIPNCRLLIYERCGHAPMQEHYEKFNSDLRGFLADANR